MLRAFAIFCFSTAASAQISPGSLTEVHAQLDGPTKCGSCHVFGAGARRFKCLDCHAEIRQRLDQKRGYHARIANRAKGSLDCIRCHTDHYGRIFNIVKWEETRDTFDHHKAGYPLEGRHARLSCDKCHRAKFISAAERKLIRVKDPTHTLLGLNAQCTTCHEDVHRGELGADCSRCHSLQNWKAAATFDHEATRYPLTGRHQDVSCQKCHTDAISGETHYKGLPFASCANCHKDPHRGAFREASFSGDCQSCHVTEGWKRVKTLSGFDHTRTRFALKGKHSDLDCFKCHKSSDFKQPVAHRRCLDCHQDPHHGQFTHRKDGGDCSPCHNELTFKRSLFTLKEHQQSAYPLLGKHAAVQCAKCHQPAGVDTRYRVPYENCLRCHRDAHASQFRNQPCEDCHTVDGFRPSTFTLSRHQQSRFLLTASHAAVACGECHKSPAGVHPPPPAQFRYEATTCEVCHEDPHRGQFQTAAARSDRSGCETCHNTRAWKETAAFDHSQTSFALEGAHRAVACTECHRPGNLGKSVRAVVFRGAPTQCGGCHEDVHGGQFQARGQTECSSCHVVSKWKLTTFDHEKTSFALAGAHRAVQCRQCHSSKQLISDRLVLVYKGTPTRCSACHSDGKEIALPRR